MKLNVFGSVAEVEGHGDGSEPLYRYELRDPAAHRTVGKMPARDFVAALFGDVLESVRSDVNYKDRYSFDRNVFQKFIALMFVNYATTDPIFYGTNRADYGVSEEKDMEATPLYVAVARELRQIECQLRDEQYGGQSVPELAQPERVSRPQDTTVVELPGTLVNEDALLAPISSICAAALQLSKQDDRQTIEFARLILADASRLVRELKRLNIVSPFAYDPGDVEHGEGPGS